jgi:large subunit ribosomal protein L18e
MKNRGPKNETVLQAIAVLEKSTRKGKKSLWKDIAKRLSKPRRRRVSTNIWKLNALKTDKKFILVPGKVLGTGQMEKGLNVIALEFSESAKKKISDKGKTLTLVEAVNEKIEAKDVVIIS